jgi:hypothetical protein
LSISENEWDLESGEYNGLAPICTVLWDAVNHQGILEEERHHSWRDIHWHHNHHHTVGALYSRAHYSDAFTLSNPGANQYSTFSMSAGNIYDEDINNAMSSAATTCNLFYHHSDGTMKWVKGSTTPYLLSGGVPQYDNGTGTGNKTASNTQGYFVSWVYGTNGTGANSNSKIAIVVGQDSDANMTLTEAQNASFPSLPVGWVVEWKLLYKMIFRYGAGATLTHISNTDYRTAGSLPYGQAPGVNPSAAAVSFSPAGNVAATNVQSAIEELDTEKQAVSTGLTDLITRWTYASASGAASLAFAEDTDNGTNTCTLQGPASTADVVVTLPSSTGTLSTLAGTETFSNKTLTDYKETLYTATTSGNVTISLANGNVQRFILDAARQFTMPADPGAYGQSFVLIIECATYTPTWNTSPVIEWLTSDGAAPTLVTTANLVNVLTFIWDDIDTRWLGFLAGKETA